MFGRLDGANGGCIADVSELLDLMTFIVECLLSGLCYCYLGMWGGSFGFYSALYIVTWPILELRTSSRAFWPLRTGRKHSNSYLFLFPFFLLLSLEHLQERFRKCPSRRFVSASACTSNCRTAERILVKFHTGRFSEMCRQIPILIRLAVLTDNLHVSSCVCARFSSEIQKIEGK